MVIPDGHSRHDSAVIVARFCCALGDEAFEGVASAREDAVGGREGERGAQVVGAITAVDDALVRVLPPQTLQLLPL